MNLGSSFEVSGGNKGMFFLQPEQLQRNDSHYHVEAAKKALNFRYGFNTVMSADLVVRCRCRCRRCWMQVLAKSCINDNDCLLLLQFVECTKASNTCFTGQLDDCCVLLSM